MATEALTSVPRPRSGARVVVDPRTARRSIFPVLDGDDHGLSARLAVVVGRDRPKLTFFAGLLLAFVAIAVVSIALGLLLTQVLLPHTGLASADERFVRWLTRDRSGGLTDASLIGSMIAGGVVLPIVAGVTALAAALMRQWRVVGFLIFAPGAGGGRVPGDDARRPPPAPGRAPPRRPARRRELLLRPHRGLDRRLLRYRAAPDLADPRTAPLRSRSGRSRSRSRSSSRSRACTAACTIRSTSPAACSSASPCSPRWCSSAAPPATRPRRGRRVDTRAEGRGRRACGQDLRRRPARAAARARGGRRRRSALGRGAEEPQRAQAGQARAEGRRRADLRLGRRRHRAALPRHGRGHEGARRDRAGRDGEPVRDEPRHPAGHPSRPSRSACAASGAASTSAASTASASASWPAPGSTRR